MFFFVFLCYFIVFLCFAIELLNNHYQKKFCKRSVKYHKGYFVQGFDAKFDNWFLGMSRAFKFFQRQECAKLSHNNTLIKNCFVYFLLDKITNQEFLSFTNLEKNENNKKNKNWKLEWNDRFEIQKCWQTPRMTWTFNKYFKTEGSFWRNKTISM